MLQAQPPHTPTSAAQAAVTRPSEAVIQPRARATPAGVLTVYHAGLDTPLASFETTVVGWEAFDAAKLPGTGSSPPMVTGRCWARWQFPRLRPSGCMPGSSNTASTSVPG